MNIKTITAVCIILLSVFIVGCRQPTEVTPTEPSGGVDTGLANPAAVYCEKQGYKLEVRTDPGGNQYGMCIFPDGSECDEWAYFRGECSPASQGSATENKAIEAAKTVLATELNIETSAISVFSQNRVTWPDSCLGLPAQGGACTEVETPGFRVTLTAGETNYTYRTDLSGENVRLETSGIQG